MPYVKSSEHKITCILCNGSVHIQFWAQDTRACLTVSFKVIHFELFIANSKHNNTYGSFMAATLPVTVVPTIIKPFVLSWN
jgi:hypothetical protein